MTNNAGIKITYLLDNDNNKHGNRLYCKELMVKSPKVIAGKDNPVMIIKEGFYNEEIKKDILHNINDAVTFI